MCHCDIIDQSRIDFTAGIRYRRLRLERLGVWVCVIANDTTARLQRGKPRDALCSAKCRLQLSECGQLEARHVPSG